MQAHNKSQTAHLSILKLTDDQIEEFDGIVYDSSYYAQGPIQDSPCLLSKPEDGRTTYLGNKYAVAHISSFLRFGREAMESIPAAKTSKDSPIISHLCGNGPRCWNPHHLAIEPKWLNDERTHCHFVFNRYFERNGYVGLDDYVKLSCPHEPRCFTI